MRVKKKGNMRVKPHPNFHPFLQTSHFFWYIDWRAFQAPKVMEMTTAHNWEALQLPLITWVVTFNHQRTFCVLSRRSSWFASNAGDGGPWWGSWSIRYPIISKVIHMAYHLDNKSCFLCFRWNVEIFSYRAEIVVWPCSTKSEDLVWSAWV